MSKEQLRILKRLIYAQEKSRFKSRPMTRNDGN